MNTRRIGPKGQVVIPKEIREKVGLREGVDVVVEARGQEVVIKRASPATENYIDYFVSTYAKKLKHEVNIKDLLEEEKVERTSIR